MPITQTLPSITDQIERLIDIGVPDIAGLSAAEVRAAASTTDRADGLLVIHPDLAPVSRLAALI